MADVNKQGNNINKQQSQNVVRDQAIIKTGWGYRHQQCVILFLSLTTAYSIRTCMGVALVAMTGVSHHTRQVELNKEMGTLNTSYRNFTEHTSIIEHNINARRLTKLLIAEGNENTTYFTDSDALDQETVLHKLMLIDPYPMFKWSKKIQDVILSSFFWGYMSLQIPAGMLVHRFGPKWLLTISLSINGALFVVFPWAALYGGWVCVMILRAMQGMSQACIFPSIHTFIGKWAPLQERGRLSGLVYGGQALGTVLGLPITGFITSTVMGWPGIFRFYGILCGSFAAVIYVSLADTPAEHPKISAAEKMCIESDMGDNKKSQTVPWKSILKSKSIWACVASHIGHTWGGNILFAEVPSYMDRVMGVNIKANGVLTALPFVAMFLSNFVFSHLSDIIIHKKISSLTMTRKLMNSIGSVSACLGLLMICFVPKNIYIVEPLLIFTCTFKIAAHMGFQVMTIDIAPNFAGTIMSLSNFCAHFIGSFAPILSGFLLSDPTSASHWNRVFFLTAGLYFISNLAFVIFASADRADWDEPERVTNKEQADTEESVPMVDHTKIDH